jgi:hypothetical protein
LARAQHRRAVPRPRGRLFKLKHTHDVPRARNPRQNATARTPIQQTQPWDALKPRLFRRRSAELPADQSS